MALEGETQASSDDTLLQRVADLKAENQALRDQLAHKDRRVLKLKDRIQQLEARLKRYENPNTPPSRRRGAAPAAESIRSIQVKC